MVRRSPYVLALVAVLLLWSPAAALAAYSATVVRPADQAKVTGTTEVHVQVRRDFADTAVAGLRVRPADGGPLRPTTCVSGCEAGGREPVFAFTFDPRTGAPFGDEIVPNGPFEFEGVISRDLGPDRSVGTLTLDLRVPGSAVGGLAATTDDDTVRLAWSRAPEPDVLGYRIERCAGVCDASGDWTGRGDVAPSASAFTDAPGVGSSSYRVVTIRNGGGDGSSIETVSAPVTAEVAPPASSSPDGEVGTDEVDGDGDDGGGDGAGQDDAGGDRDEADATDRSRDRGADGADTGSSDGDQLGAPPSAGSARPKAPRSSRPPAVPLGPAGARIPEPPVLEDVFRSELDYAEDDAQAAAGEGEGDEVILSAPGGSGGSFPGVLGGLDRFAVPLAGGLLATAVGLHLRRWLRIPSS